MIDSVKKKCKTAQCWPYFGGYHTLADWWDISADTRLNKELGGIQGCGYAGMRGCGDSGMRALGNSGMQGCGDAGHKRVKAKQNRETSRVNEKDERRANLWAEPILSPDCNLEPRIQKIRKKMMKTKLSGGLDEKKEGLHPPENKTKSRVICIKQIENQIGIPEGTTTLVISRG